jgi:hypothetical protein
MANQHETDAFKVMQEDVAVLRRWVEDHRKEHTADTELLASIIDQIHQHSENHHGRTSVLKQAGGVTAIAALAVAAAEILRIFLG